MSDNDEIIIQDLQLLDDTGDCSRISDDSCIKDWSDEMTIQAEPCLPLEEKQKIPIESVNQQKNLDNPKIPVEDSCEDIFPAPFCADVKILSSLPERVKKDVQDENGISGVCGLYNLCNTCFINSALQCLFATPVIKDLMRGVDIGKHDDLAVTNSFVEELQEVFKKISSGTYSALYTDSLHSAISQLHPSFGDYKQHDSQEFISFILNSFHDHLNNSNALSFKNNDDKKTLLELSDSITGEVSKRLKMDHSVSVESDSMEAGVDCEEETVLKATCAWRDYTKENDSVIVDKFHGQFQSVITCEKCGFVSTTHEPFMFLSLPIPYAMERQIVITWVPEPKVVAPPGVVAAPPPEVSAVKRYLVTVSKNGLVEDLKKTFLLAIKQDDAEVNINNIVFAQVKNSANVKIIDDKTQLKYLSKTSSVCAVEVISFVNQAEQNGIASNSEDVTMATASTWHTCSICFEEKFEEELLVHRSCNGILCSSCVCDTLNFMKNDNGDFPCPTCSCYIQEIAYEPMIEKVGRREPTENSERGEEDKEKETSLFGAASKWYTCSICLEEIFDEDIRSHLECGGMMCANCLSTTAGFYEHKGFACPTCGGIIVESDYKAIAKEVKETKKLRQVIVPILFRHQKSDTKSSRKFRLFGNPLITCLLSQVTSSDICRFAEDLMERVNLKNVQYEVVVTDSSGLSCGSCDLMSSCSGCRVKDLENIKLKPGCCIALEFMEDCSVVISTLSFSKDDKSLNTLRESDVVTLDECIQKFADVEILTKDNPWFCPQCKTNQAATKIMAITRWPEVLIVHLKRFHFEGAQGSKITCPVDFPLCGLNVEILSCAETRETRKSNVYDLYGCINHTGSLFGGHYTAFTKGSNITVEGNKESSPPEWYFFNDETYTKKLPPEDADYQTEAYVLFFQLKAT